jgi:hypothetical protein
MLKPIDANILLQKAAIMDFNKYHSLISHTDWCFHNYTYKPGGINQYHFFGENIEVYMTSHQQCDG